MNGPHWHEHNPWKDELLYITLEEFKSLMMPEYKTERYFQGWGDKLDAYILPHGSIGLRYGAEGHEYLSPFCHPMSAIRFLFNKLRWQPIETAPKDGTLIILHDAARVASGVGRWRQVASHDTLNDIDGVAQFRREYGWRSASDKAINNATHWMPLPGGP